MTAKYFIPVTLFAAIVLLLLFLHQERHKPWFFHLGINVGWNKWGREVDTMVKVRQVCTALEMYAVDHLDLLPEPPVPTQPLPAAMFVPFWDHQNYEVLLRPPSPWPKNPKRKVSRLKVILGPHYASDLPETDYWGNPLYFDISSDRKHYMVMSLGSDGDPDGNLLYWFPPSQTFRDIASFNGTFLSSPEGSVH